MRIVPGCSSFAATHEIIINRRNKGYIQIANGFAVKADYSAVPEVHTTDEHVVAQIVFDSRDIAAI